MVKGITLTLNRLERDTVDSYMEMPDCEIAVAVACVAAVLRGMPMPKGFPEELSNLTSNTNHVPTHKEVARCLAMLEMALGKKAEINEEGVWGSESDYAQWLNQAEEVRSFLIQLPAEQQKRGCLGF